MTIVIYLLQSYVLILQALHCCIVRSPTSTSSYTAVCEISDSVESLPELITTEDSGTAPLLKTPLNDCNESVLNNTVNSRKSSSINPVNVGNVPSLVNTVDSLITPSMMNTVDSRNATMVINTVNTLGNMFYLVVPCLPVPNTHVSPSLVTGTGSNVQIPEGNQSRIKENSAKSDKSEINLPVAEDNPAKSDLNLPKMKIPRLNSHTVRNLTPEGKIEVKQREPELCTMMIKNKLVYLSESCKRKLIRRRKGKNPESDNYIYKRKVECDTMVGLYIEKVSDTEFRCKLCSDVFRWNYLCELHVRKKHTNERPFKCTICDKSYTDNYLLTKHSLVHRPTGRKTYPCSYCKKEFKHKNYVKLHEKIHLTKTESFPCDKCDSSFNNSFKLAYHIRHVHNQVDAICDVCGIHVSSISVLNRHRIIHTDNSEDLVHCDRCGKTCRSEYALKRHLAFHNLKGFYTCQSCNMSFSSKRGLSTHKRQHISRPTAS